MEKYQQLLARKRAEYDYAVRAVEEEESKLAQAKMDLTTAARAQEILQAAAEVTQTLAHARIASIVTRCLKSVFGAEAYEFRLTFAKKRGKTEAQIVLIRDGKELDPRDSVGGGVIDVVSFALRLMSLLLSLPPKRRLLVLDEPMKMLSKEYTPAAKEMLEVLSEELGIQIIMVTHNVGLACGQIITL